MMMFNKKKCHTDVFCLRNEQSIFVMAEERPLANYVARNGEAFVNFERQKPFLVDADSYEEKCEEAWEYICNVADVQKGGGNNRELFEIGFQVNIDNYFKRKEY